MVVFERNIYKRSAGEIGKAISEELKFNWFGIRTLFCDGYTGWRIGPFFCVRHTGAETWAQRVFPVYLYGAVLGGERARVYTLKSLFCPLYLLCGVFLIVTAALLIAGYAWDAPALGAICGAGVWALVTVGNVFNYFLIGGRANSEELDYFLERLHRQESESAQPDETPPETPDGAAE